MTREELIKAEMLPIDEQRKSFDELRENYCAVLRAESIRGTALTHATSDQHKQMNGSTRTGIFLGDVSDVYGEKVQTLNLCFDTPFYNPEGEQRRYRCLIPVANLYPETNGTELQNDFSDPEARVVMAVMRGMMRARQDYLQDMSPNLDRIIEDV